MAGNTIVAGAPQHQIGVYQKQGAAYVFVEPASGWANATQTGELTASNGFQGDELGYAVGISGNTIVAGAPYAFVGANPDQGAAYVFVEPSLGWANSSQTAELTASDGGAGNSLGASVAISGNTIVAGAEGNSAAYVFQKPSSGWITATQTAKLTASNGGLGSSVAISGNTIVSGATGQNNQQNSAPAPRVTATDSTSSETSRLVAHARRRSARRLAARSHPRTIPSGRPNRRAIRRCPTPSPARRNASPITSAPSRRRGTDHAGISTCVVTQISQRARRGLTDPTSSRSRTSRERANPHRDNRDEQAGHASSPAASAASKRSGGIAIESIQDHQRAHCR